MKRALIYILLLSTFYLLSSCNNNDEPEVQCAEPVGELNAIVNDSLALDHRWVEFFNNDDGSIALQAGYANEDCVLRSTIEFFTLEKTVGVQPLRKSIFGTGQPLLSGATIFQTWDTDVLTEKFALYEGEPGWLEITELQEDRIKGRFQATYVYVQSAQRFWNLADTLRFNNVPFEAPLRTPINSN